jgi:Protein of unknown function (DUF3379)
MMTCTEYRKSILAEPQQPSAEMRAHVASCQDCTAYTEQLLRFEGRLDRALRLSTEKSSQAQPLPQGRSDIARTRRVRRRAFAVAASAVVAAVVVGSLWLSSFGVSLASDVVTHMAGEPQAWARTDVPVPSPELTQVLSESHVRLKSDAVLVSYASSCLFRGRQVPHLVVQTAAGPVTVMVLTHESVMRPVHFDEHGYRGMIVPVQGHGSLAVLQRQQSTDVAAVNDVAARLRGAIDYTE